MDYNRNMSEFLAVLAKYDPQSLAAGTVTIGPFQTNNARRFLALIQVGAIGTSVDAKFQAATTSGGTYTDIPGATITQITTSNKVAELELRSESLESLLGIGYQWVRLSITGVGTNLLAAAVLSDCARFEPNSANNIAAVASITVV